MITPRFFFRGFVKSFGSKGMVVVLLFYGAFYFYTKVLEMDLRLLLLHPMEDFDTLVVVGVVSILSIWIFHDYKNYIDYRTNLMKNKSSRGKNKKSDKIYTRSRQAHNAASFMYLYHLCLAGYFALCFSYALLDASCSCIAVCDVK